MHPKAPNEVILFYWYTADPRNYHNMRFYGGLLVCSRLESDDNWMLLDDLISSSIIGCTHSITRGSSHTCISDLIDKAHSEIDFTNGKHVIRCIWPAILLLPLSLSNASAKIMNIFWLIFIVKTLYLKLVYHHDNLIQSKSISQKTDGIRPLLLWTRTIVFSPRPFQYL